MLPKIEYLNICPIEKEKANNEEILNYGFKKEHFLEFQKNIWEILEEKIDADKLLNFKEEYLIYQKIKEFEDFFQKNFNYKPLKIQIYWLKRVLRKESFSIIAPTGIGKTTFGIALSHFFQGKIYYLVPSKILLREIEEKLKKINSSKKILVIKETKDKSLLNNDYDILLTTANFLHKNFDILPKNFDLVFIDDADSLIRQPRNIDKILKLIKFKEQEIEKALEIIDKKRKAKNKNDYLAIKNLAIDKIKKGVVIASSATLTPKSKRIALFRELLGFEIGSATTNLRNVEEVYEEIEKEKLWERSIEIIKKLDNGGFIFLSDDFSKEELNKYVEFLNQNQISAISYEKFNSKNQKKFLDDEIQVVVGFSNIRNPLTRGIDLPQKIRYSLFLGVPKFKIPLKSSFSPLHLFLLGLSLREILEDEKRNIIERNLNFLKKISFLKEENVLADENLKKKLEPIKNIYDEILKDKNLKDKIEKHPYLALEINNENLYLIVSDPRGYLQASGRTSRLFPFGLTKGLAYLLVENIKVLKHLENKLKILGYDSKFLKRGNVNLDELIKKIDEDRGIVKKVLAGEEFIFQDPIETALVIVESPTKAKTIANFFGRPAKRIKNGVYFYEISIGNLHLNICSSLGHFVDLLHSEGIYGVKKENGDFVPLFQPLKICSNCQRHLDVLENTCPICQNKDFINKEDLIKILQKAASEVNKVYLATDPDTEGEKIAFDLFFYLYPYNKNIERIELHEITRSEFLKRINEPRKIDFNLVKAQLLRRISDRWIGFKLSEEVQIYFKNLNLSAGRVQTPVLGWILEREKKAKEKHYLIKVNFENKTFSFYSEDKNLIENLKKEFKDGKLNVEVKIFEEKEEIINPLPPYDTSDLLKDSFQFFKFDAPLIMRLAQDLFENGLITYHRTDSHYISDFGKYIAQEYLEKKNQKNLFYSRSFDRIGTHEAIRPTRPIDVQDLIEEAIISGQRILTKRHLQLYGLIFNRFLASQMKPSKALKIVYEIKLKNNLYHRDTCFSKIIKENHLQYFRNLRILEITPGIFPVKNLSIRKTSKEFHYSQGEIIDEMKKRGLGRPSTYSVIVQTLLERKYVISRSGYLILIDWGEKIYNYLIKRYPELISEDFTKELEEKMDLVAEGKEDYQKILNETFKQVFGK